jgi:hypothetical protein
MNSNSNIIITVIKVVSILLIIIIFNIIIYQYLSIENKIVSANGNDSTANVNIEKFNQNTGVIDYENPSRYKPYNTRIMYENTGDYPWNRHTINSSIPYDVNVKKEAINVYYYEFDNSTFDSKLKQTFKSNCEELIIAVEGSDWKGWRNPKTLTDVSEKNKLKYYYDNIFDFVVKKLQSNIMDLPGEDKKQKIQVVHDIMLRYRTHNTYPSYYLYRYLFPGWHQILLRNGYFKV